MEYKKHPSSIIDSGAKIGKDTMIWHFSHVCAGAKIGKNVSIGQNVYIGNNVTIGDFCKIQNNISIYDNVKLEDYVFCGPSMVFTNVYNPRSKISRKNEYRDTIVKKGATIGANATIVCGVTIGEFAFIGAGTLINKNVKDYALVVGNPGKHIGWMSEYGERISLPLSGKGEYTCPNTKKQYLLVNDKLTICD
tara:strand:- start:8346 stop:8924 length:579 start_codon:yes stop_codon:yes gene_type:complete